MNKKELTALIDKASEGKTSEEDMAQAMKFIRKSFYEKALNAELDDHLGYEKHDANHSKNSHNGHFQKTVYSDSGALDIDTLRYRQGSFEPQEDQALQALNQFGEKWDNKYPQISKSWHAHWGNLNTLFNYPEDILRAIYTTNAIESLNSVIRKDIKKRKLFPTDDSAKKVVYLAIQAAFKKWTAPIRNWKPALNHFMIEFEERLADYR